MPRRWSARRRRRRSATVVVGSAAGVLDQRGDPDGDAVRYTWTRRRGRTRAGTASSLTFSPVDAQVGEHEVAVTASDGTGGGDPPRLERLRRRLDADGMAGRRLRLRRDDPAVHPTANELLGNGIDDDCDTGTPDAPPGGLTGSLWSWGSNHNGTVGTGFGTTARPRLRSRSPPTTTRSRSRSAIAPSTRSSPAARCVTGDSRPRRTSATARCSPPARPCRRCRSVAGRARCPESPRSRPSQPRHGAAQRRQRGGVGRQPATRSATGRRSTTGSTRSRC